MSRSREGLTQGNDETGLPPRVPLANLPTPVHQLDALSRRLGRRVFVKRDDLTGCAASGNKIRKLEYVLHEALRSGADTVITAGAVQSNHCRATAVACRMTGLRPILLLRHNAEPLPAGNLFLDRLMGAEILLLEPEEYYGRLRTVVDDLIDREAAAGRKAVFVPVGASSELGCLGYVRCAAEIAGWQDSNDLGFDRIYHAAGSGGTSAGLLLGARLHGLEASVRGVNVGEPHGELVERIRSLLQSAADLIGLGTHEPPEPEIIEGCYGSGYADIPDGLPGLIRSVARQDGIVLDPVYTGKAMACLIREEETLEPGNVLFIHTGGIFGLLGIDPSLILEG